MFLFQEISQNTIILALVGGVVGILTIFLNGVVAIILAKINAKATVTQVAAVHAAERVEEVKTALIESDAHTNKQLIDIHTLVNSRFSALLKVNAQALRKIADSSRDAEDEAAAVYAETAVSEHESELKLVTRGKK